MARGSSSSTTCQQQLLLSTSQTLAASIQQLHAAWGDSTPEACIQLLQYCLHNIQSSSNSDMLQSPDLDETYLYCAERLWQLLPAPRQAQLRDACLNSCLCAVEGTTTQRRLQVLAYGLLHQHKQAGSYAWLLQHQLLPARLIDQGFRHQLAAARSKAIKAGLGVHTQRALLLHRHIAAVQASTAQQAEGGEGPDAGLCGMGSWFTLDEFLQGRLAAACAACDAAAVAQLELSYALRTPPPLSPARSVAKPATTVYTAPTNSPALQA